MKAPKVPKSVLYLQPPSWIREVLQKKIKSNDSEILNPSKFVLQKFINVEANIKLSASNQNNDTFPPPQTPFIFFTPSSKKILGENIRYEIAHLQNKIVQKIMDRQTEGSDDLPKLVSQYKSMVDDLKLAKDHKDYVDCLVRLEHCQTALLTQSFSTTETTIEEYAAGENPQFSKS